MKFLSTSGAVLLPLAATVVGAIELKPDDENSIKDCSSKYAKGLMSSYKYNDASLSKEQRGYWPKPYYWWESGAIWGGVIEYSQTFGDSQYAQTVQDALAANYGPKNDFIMEDKRDQQGNDDQAFWCLATMSALEYSFPEPANAPASYLEVTENCFKNIMSRWDTKTCGGGLKWQIYPDNANAGGYNYKNAISNGAAFALAARLARFTGKSEYSDWAKTIYDWSAKVGLIGPNFEVFDGTDDKTNCATITGNTEWSYNIAMYMHGSAFMYDVTKGDNVWKDRVSGFLDHADIFFQNPDRVKNVMFERCEFSTKFCNLDQQSFKAYLSRWMAKTAVLAPFTADKISDYLKTSAVAAGKTCTDDGSKCGTRWYKNTFDGIEGLGQQLNALEVTQALITLKKKTLPGTGGSSAPKPSSSAAPQSSSSVAPPPSSSVAPPPSSSAAPPPSSSVAPISSTKPVETKPTEKPVESLKPIESKPAESKPVFSFQPEQPKPEATKPADKPAENQPAASAPSTTCTESKVPAQTPTYKPIESKPVESKPIESKPVPSATPSTSCTESKVPAPTKPVESKPTESKPVESKPIESKPTTSSLAPPAPIRSGEGFKFTPAPAPASCSCTGKKVVTVWVPPTAVPAPPASSSAVPPPPPSSPVAKPPASSSAVPPPSSPVAKPPASTPVAPPPVAQTPPSNTLVPYPAPTRNATALPTGTGTPGNSSIPVVNFPGAAPSTMMAGSTLVAAVALAALSALL